MFDNIHLIKQTHSRLTNTPCLTVLSLVGALVILALLVVVCCGFVLVLSLLADEAWALLESFAVNFIRQVRW